MQATVLRFEDGEREYMRDTFNPSLDGHSL
jgi:hypothetical protein